MPSIVEQIQLEAVSSDVPVSQLLRRMKLAAVKLKLTSTAAWVDHEIEGYGSAAIPDYRLITGSPVAHNPYNGWIPVQAPASMMQYMRKREIRQSIASLEALLPGKGMVFFQYAPEVIDALNRGADIEFARVGLNVDKSTIVGILDRVRGKALDWAIDIEKAGITGSGVSFTAEEVRKASNVNIQIESFSGNLNSGDVVGQGARVNLGSTDNSTNVVGASAKVFDDLERLAVSIPNLDGRAAVEAEIKQLRSTVGTGKFAAAYQRFISSAADHMTLFAPLIPALTALINVPN